MNEEPTQDLASSDLSRRKMLQRSAFVVGAAAVWSTPIVQTLGQRPAAANSDTVSPYWVEFSVIGARVTISGATDSANGTFVVKYDGSDDGTEGGWQIGNIPCPEWGGSDTLGSDINLVVEPTTDPTETEVSVCYMGNGSITWVETTIKIGNNCHPAESTQDGSAPACAVFETDKPGN